MTVHVFLLCFLIEVRLSPAKIAASLVPAHPPHQNPCNILAPQIRCTLTINGVVCQTRSGTYAGYVQFMTQSNQNSSSTRLCSLQRCDRGNPFIGFPANRLRWMIGNNLHLLRFTKNARKLLLYHFQVQNQLPPQSCTLNHCCSYHICTSKRNLSSNATIALPVYY